LAGWISVGLEDRVFEALQDGSVEGSVWFHLVSLAFTVSLNLGPCRPRFGSFFGFW
jgi:hypothetical protein